MSLFLADIHSTPDPAAGGAFLLVLLAAFVAGLWRAHRNSEPRD